jgi:anti-sigma-K factor RskA
MADDALHELTAAYALDALDQEDERAYEEHLSRCAQCREELAGFRDAAGALALAVEPAEPPAALRGRILDAARSERPNVVTLRPRWAYPVAAVAAVAACAAIGFGVWAAELNSRDHGLRTIPLAGAAGSVVVSDDGSAALVVAGMRPAPAGKTWEAWVLKGDRAYPAGIFHGGGATTVVRLGQRLSSGARVGVTLERAGGVKAPTSQPLVTSQPA